MLTRNKILIVGFIAFFGLQQVLAASISTRVRVLESKVAKQDRVVKSLRSDYSNQSTLVKSELSKIRALEDKVDALIKTKKSGPKVVEDKRYAFP